MPNRRKAVAKYNWKKRGIKFKDNSDFELWWKRYEESKNCELCNKIYKNSHDICIDHCHNTGKPRNIVCQQCNRRKKDTQMPNNNKSGEKYLYYTKGLWVFERRTREGKKIFIRSKDKEIVIKKRDEFFKNNPNYFS